MPCEPLGVLLLLGVQRNRFAGPATLRDTLDLTDVRHAVDSLAASGARFDSALAAVTARGTGWLDRNRRALISCRPKGRIRQLPGA